jgi:hypothetical protein
MPGNPREMITMADRRFPVRIRIAVPLDGLGRRFCFRRGGRRNCSPYWRTIAAAGLRRMPTAPRSSMKVHSAAIRLTTSSGANIDVITVTSFARSQPPCTSGHAAGRVLSLYRQRPYSFSGMIPEIDIWRTAQLMLKRYGDNALDESMGRADELAAGDDQNGAATWRRIATAVEQLANTIPPGPVH